MISDAGNTGDYLRAHATAARGNETILLTEDEDAIRLVLQRVLEKYGYRVLVAKDGAEATTVAREYEGQIHLLVTDMMMPVLSGRELAVGLRAQRPELPVLFLSGYTDGAMADQGLLDEGEQFLQKPFAVETLAKRVRETLDASARSTGR